MLIHELSFREELALLFSLHKLALQYPGGIHCKRNDARWLHVSRRILQFICEGGTSGKLFLCSGGSGDYIIMYYLHIYMYIYTYIYMYIPQLYLFIYLFIVIYLFINLFLFIYLFVYYHYCYHDYYYHYYY